jgi:hypothetical protein
MFREDCLCAVTHSSRSHWSCKVSTLIEMLKHAQQSFDNPFHQHGL